MQNNVAENPNLCPEGKSRQASASITLSVDADGRDHSSSPGGISSNFRKHSISLQTAFNQRKGLLGALISGIGSNISLPSCMPQDQDVPIGGAMGRRMSQLQPSQQQQQQLQPSQQQQQHLLAVSLSQARPEMRQDQKSNYLQLTPINTGCIPLNTMDTTKHTHSAGDSTCVKKRKSHGEILSIVSTLYAKFLIVVGFAVPVTASVNETMPIALDKGFYLYLYLTSVTFVITMYAIVLKDKAVNRLTQQDEKCEQIFTFNPDGCRMRTAQTQQYGSFCLRLGAVGFGAGSLVFTGLQIGAEIASGPFRAITPSARLLLVTAQMHFIFLNSKSLELTKHPALAKLGLMHMIATNICEWLQALIEETQHEIDQLGNIHEGEEGLLRSLLTDASPFLFPCTIEFSLICAVILFEMWKRVDEGVDSKSEGPTRSSYQLSVDCSSSHRGLFGGILIVAATILSLIMFFVLKKAKLEIAVLQVTALDGAIFILGTITAIASIAKLESLELKDTTVPRLDSTLLTAAQAGVYLHYLFGLAGGILTMGPGWVLSLVTDLLALIQSTSQTLLIKIAWRRRCYKEDKPGKELITFLIVVNIALWTVNTLEKSRASVRPDHLRFFGIWAWTIITHVSMPLGIFYRFHSAICLFEIWKACYKCKPTGIMPTSP